MRYISVVLHECIVPLSVIRKSLISSTHTWKSTHHTHQSHYSNTKLAHNAIWTICEQTTAAADAVRSYSFIRFEVKLATAYLVCSRLFRIGCVRCAYVCERAHLQCMSLCDVCIANHIFPEMPFQASATFFFRPLLALLLYALWRSVRARALATPSAPITRRHHT